MSAYIYFCFSCRVWVWAGHGSGVHGPATLHTRADKIRLARAKR